MKNSQYTTNIESNSFKLVVNLCQIMMHAPTKLEGEHTRSKIADSDRPWANDEDNDRQSLMHVRAHFGSDSKAK